MKFWVRNKLELQKRALGKIRLEWKQLVLCSQNHGGDVERVRACEDVDIERTVVRIADGAGGLRPWLKASAMAGEKREEKRRARRGEEEKRRRGSTDLGLYLDWDSILVLFGNWLHRLPIEKWNYLNKLVMMWLIMESKGGTIESEKAVVVRSNKSNERGKRG